MKFMFSYKYALCVYFLLIFICWTKNENRKPSLELNYEEGYRVLSQKLLSVSMRI